jgi:hypothetical protein
VRKDFDPYMMVPQDDEEAMVALQRDDKLLTAILRVLYQSYRGREEGVLEAFEKTLLTYVNPGKSDR